jgi:hypothetical protein
VSAWFRAPHAIHSIGSGFTEGSDGMGMADVLPLSFDVLFFVARTTFAKQNPGGATQPPPPFATPTNLDFEEGGAEGLPDGWIVSRGEPAGFHAATLTKGCAHGARCVTITHGTGYGESWGEIGQRFEAAPYRGKKLRVGASLRATGPATEARLCVFIQHAGAMRSMSQCDAVVARAAGAGSGWHDEHVELAIPDDASNLILRLMLVGDGVASFDAVSVDVIP